MSEVDEAQLLIGRFYRRKRDEIETMRWALGLAATLFTNGMNEKEIKSLSEQVFDAALGFAIATLPGGFFLSKTWKSIAERAPVFAERLQFAQSTVYDAAGRVRDLVKDADARGGSSTFSNQLANNLKGVYGKLNRGLSALEAEQTTMENRLIELAKRKETGLVAEIRATLGEIPPVLQPHQRDLFVTILEYQLFKTYCAGNVRVTMTHAIFDQRKTWDVKGLNSGQLKYIYTRFGTEVTEQQFKEFFEALAKTLGEARNLGEIGMLLRKNIKNQTPLWPINGPHDIAKHWGAKLIVTQESLQVVGGML